MARLQRRVGGAGVGVGVPLVRGHSLTRTATRRRCSRQQPLLRLTHGPQLQRAEEGLLALHLSLNSLQR